MAKYRFKKTADKDIKRESDVETHAYKPFYKSLPRLSSSACIPLKVSFWKYLFISIFLNLILLTYNSGPKRNTVNSDARDGFIYGRLCSLAMGPTYQLGLGFNNKKQWLDCEGLNAEAYFSPI